MHESLYYIAPESGKARSNANSHFGSVGMVAQGDMPVDLKDLAEYADMDYPQHEDYVASVNSGEDIEEGVSLQRTMHQSTMVRKNSDY